MTKPQNEFEERVKKIEDILWAVYSAHEEPHSSSAVIYYAMNKIEEAIREAREEGYNDGEKGLKARIEAYVEREKNSNKKYMMWNGKTRQENLKNNKS